MKRLTTTTTTLRRTHYTPKKEERHYYNIILLQVIEPWIKYFIICVYTHYTVAVCSSLNITIDKHLTSLPLTEFTYLYILKKTYDLCTHVVTSYTNKNQNYSKWPSTRRFHWHSKYSFILGTKCHRHRTWLVYDWCMVR